MRPLVFLILVIISSSLATRLISSDEITALFKRVLRDGVTEADAQTFQDVVDIVRRPATLREGRAVDSLSAIRMTLDCLICRSAFAALFSLVGEGQEDAQLIGSVGFLCTALGIESATVCDGVIKLNLPILTYIIRQQPLATAGAFCGLVMQSATDPAACPFSDPRFEWTVTLPPPAAPPVQNTSSTEPPMTIALIADAHIDPLYEPFGVADCSEPTCCRKGQQHSQHYVYKSHVNDALLEEAVVKGDGIQLDLSVAERIRGINGASRTRYPVSRSREPAGYWGDYRGCDTPIWAYDDVIDRIKEAHPACIDKALEELNSVSGCTLIDAVGLLVSRVVESPRWLYLLVLKNGTVDAIYYIGDTIDHGVWETTYAAIAAMNRHMVDKLRSAFPRTPLVPTIGNHEAQPTNQFAPASVTEAGLNTTWLYSALWDKWRPYLPEEARPSLLRRGDFAMRLRPGLKVISLNNNVAYAMNWWVVYDPTEQQRQLQWLVDELAAAERGGDRVHIVTHIPPGVGDLTHAWTREYSRVVSRFARTIAAEFNGHTHADEFKVFYSAGDPGGASEPTPTAVAWGVGGATAYTNYNPNYKIATVHAASFEPLNIQTYVYNLTEANLTPSRRPHWFQLYDFKNIFRVNDLTPTSINDLVHRMVTTDKHLLDVYSALFSKVSDNRLWSCGEGCKLNNLCKIVVTVLWDRQRCEELLALYHSY